MILVLSIRYILDDYYKERWGSLKHRPVEPDELQTLDCVFNYKDLLVRTRNLIVSQVSALLSGSALGTLAITMSNESMEFECLAE